MASLHLKMSGRRAVGTEVAPTDEGGHTPVMCPQSIQSLLFALTGLIVLEIFSGASHTWMRNKKGGEDQIG